MGNCFSDENQKEPTLREVNALPSTGYDHQANDSSMQMPQSMNYPGYAGDPRGMYYQPSGPMMLFDPYTDMQRDEDMDLAEEMVGRTILKAGATYACDPEAYHAYTEEERRHHRRKEKRKSQHRDDNENEEKDDNAADTSRARRQSSGKKVENKAPATSTSKPVTSAPPPQRPVDYKPHDVIISYSRLDKEIMQKIKGKLEAQGISVWVDVASIEAGADFLSKIGEAIIDAKMFVCILSEMAVKSKYCRDEVALAYVSNTAIYPVSTLPQSTLLALMDTGLKLQLSNYNWIALTDPDTVDSNINTLVSTMKAELDDLNQVADGGPLSSSPVAADGGETASPTDVVVGVPGEQGTSPTGDRQPAYPSTLRLRERNLAVTSVTNDNRSIMPDKFWSDRFGTCDKVDWDRFINAFMEEFREQVEQTFPVEDQSQLKDILKRELEVEDDNLIFKYQFMTFCSPHGVLVPVWQRVREQARESFAMREVFNMDSSVRVEAIENLGKFRSAAVIDALRDLLADPDANVRAVATVSLSRTNANDPVTIKHIMRMLNDKDRLVREAGCLALGHLKARQAISKLTHIWRNDVISHVREAASVALHQIGGPEVEDAMRVTKVLAEEIRSLTELPVSS